MIMPRALFVAAFLAVATGGAWPQVQYPNTAPQAPPPGTMSPSPAAPSPAAPSPAAPSDKLQLWGALAFTADGSWATAWSKPSKAEAESNVAVACAKFGRGQCEIVSFDGRYCAALATYIGSHSRHRYKLSFSGGGLSMSQAQSAAMERCDSDSRTRGRCQLRTTVCGDGR
jgi:Domain of unknown function (DUF4189)